MEVNNIDSKPFFSVLVPVYNQEKYLPECIESVLNQTFKDFELILVDDGSTDSSGMLCDQYAQEHLVVRYLQEEPTGYGRLSIQTDARRRGLEDLLRGPAARSFRRLWEEQQELHSLEEQALFRAGLSMGLALGGRVRDLE